MKSGSKNIGLLVLLLFYFCPNIFCQINIKKIQFNFKSDIKLEDTVVKVKIFDSKGLIFDTLGFLNKSFYYPIDTKLKYQFGFTINRKVFPVEGIIVEGRKFSDTTYNVNFYSSIAKLDEYVLDTIFYPINEKLIPFDILNLLCPVMTDNLFNQVVIECYYSNIESTKSAFNRVTKLAKEILKTCNYSENKVNIIYSFEQLVNRNSYIIIRLKRKEKH